MGVIVPDYLQFNGDLTGDITSNLTGDITSNLTGDLTGDQALNIKPENIKLTSQYSQHIPVKTKCLHGEPCAQSTTEKGSF